MGRIEDSRIIEKDIEIKREHGFRVQFDLTDLVTNQNLVMSTAYTMVIKHWEDNTSVLKVLSARVSGNIVEGYFDSITGLRLGEYFYIIQPKVTTVNHRVTMKGNFIVE